jgi:hypothetical protein
MVQESRYQNISDKLNSLRASILLKRKTKSDLASSFPTEERPRVIKQIIRLHMDMVVLVWMAKELASRLLYP